MRKSKNRMYRWIAVVMTAALLVGQCQVPVLAKEESAPVETGVSAENKADAQEDGAGVTDKDTPKESDTDNGGAGDGVGDGTDGAGGGADNSGTDGAGSGAGDGGSGTDNNGTDGAGGGAENGGTGEGGSGTGNGGTDGAGGGADNSGTGEGGSGTGNGGTDSAGGGNGTGNGGTGESGSDADNVGTDGAGDDANNGGADDAGENVPGAGDVGTGDEDEDQSGEDGALNKCVCETACTEDAVNVDCPVCAADYAACVGKEGELSEETVSGNELDGEDGIALLAADGVGARASEITHDGIKYTVLVDGGVEVEVARQDDNAVSGDITIPGSFEENGVTYRVTSIGDEAFKYCKSLRSIKIPDGITNIADMTFYFCENLVSVELPQGIISIGKHAFANCKSLSTIKLPESVNGIGMRAFESCENLSSINIPNGIVTIREGVFIKCKSLSDIEIPDSVRSIDKYAFWQCAGLKRVRLPNWLQNIEYYAFADCSSLESVEIPNGVTDIGESAFSDCSSLEEVKIPDNVTVINKYTFRKCSSLREIILPDGVTNIKDSAFYECKSLIKVEIPDSVTEIWHDAFAECHQLSDVNIPEGLTKIGTRAFNRCNITNVTIPAGIVDPGDLGAWAFKNCNKLETVTIPNTLSNVNEAFLGCDKLKTLRIVVSEERPDAVPYAMSSFSSAQDSRNPLIFLAEDGTSLTGDMLTTVQRAFKADKWDGNTWDNLWWGWNLGDVQDTPTTYQITYHLEDYTPLPEECQYTIGGFTLPEPKRTGFIFDGWYKNAEYSGDKVNVIGSTETGDKEFFGRWIEETIPAYTVIVNARKDENTWPTAHNRTFALTKDNAATFTTALDAVEPGTYTIYDVTGLTADEFQSKGVNTGVTVPVVNADATATVDYYTATFYDLDADGNEVEYRDSTDQRPQTVLKTAGRVTKPVTDPEKAGHTFEKWVTAPGGDDEFNFALAEITEPTKIYAKWKVNTAPTYTVTINVKKDGNPWSGHGRTFALLGGGGSGFLEATGQAGDSTYSISQVPDGTYRIYDITGVPADSLYSRARDTGAEVRVGGADTGVDVTVNGADVEKDVHYYTATFYDGTDAYKTGTPQEPQIILREKTAAKPEDPQKADWQFAGWKTTKDGDTAYDFDTPVTDVTSIFASWVKKTAEQLQITADATEGGTIDPAGDIAVTKGGEVTFTITPDEGYRIKTVTADGDDVTAELKETLVRAQTGARYYTFSNVTRDHTIHAVFEADSSDKPGGGEDKPGEGDNKPGGGEDKPGEGDNKPGGGEDKPGEGDNKPGGGEDKPNGDGNKPGGGEDKPNGDGDKKDDGSDNGGGNGSSGGGNGTPYNTSTGDGTGTARVTVVSQTSVIQTSGGQDGSAGNQGASTAGKTANGSEPKTNDTTYVEVYATLAMIAGLTYLLLYFMEDGRGMTEREKEVFVAAFIRWAKKGGRFRRCCAVVAIFCLLVYYHSIGKRAGKAGFDRECLRQAL